MECLPSWNGLSIDRSEVALDDGGQGVISQTPHWSVRRATCGGAQVVLYSCRSTPLKLELWTVAIDTLQFVAPFPHPNIVQFLGVVTQSDLVQSDIPPPHECIVMEYLPKSLYDVLHRDHISLSRRQIAAIAIQVLQTLIFLHRKQQSLGTCLTSKKVMMDGAKGIKLRRFGFELVLRSGRAPSQLSSPALQTVYEMTPDLPATSMSPTKCSSSNSSPSSLSPSRSCSVASRCSSESGTSATPSTDAPHAAEFTSIKQDLYAFGVLLLEMCTCEKPTNELFNRISGAKQVDPVFYDILQLTLSLGGVVHAEDRRRSSAQVKADELLAILVANEQQRAAEELRLSSSMLPSFVHADRYFATEEASQIEVKLRERDRRGEIDLKRLAAVEQELLDEQKNFAVLVLQLEQAQQIGAQETKEKQRLQRQLEIQDKLLHESDEKVKQLKAQGEVQEEHASMLQASLDEERKRVEALQLSKIADADEKQGLLFEILKLKDEKRKVAVEKQEVEAECAAITRKVSGEKEALEDLEGRLAQAIYRWEEEQRVRRKIERQVESISRQLLQMEEERCKYSSVLQQSPTRKLVPKESLSYVLTLKDKEVEGLSRELQEALDGQSALHSNISRYEAILKDVTAEKNTLLAQQADAQCELLSLSSRIEEYVGDIDGLRKQLQGANSEIEILKSRLVDFEDEMDRQAKKRVDEEKARKLRQCLTPQCDAPRYLVGASGYCKECEERSGHTPSIRDAKKQRHRRHRSWDDASIGGVGVRKAAKNIPIMRLVSELTGGDNEDTRVEDADQQQLLEALKQLTSLLKSDDSLKDDLPECLVIKSVLALMYQHRRNLVLQLEGCRCLSVVVFNHDRNRLIVVAEGGVDPVVAAMKVFQLEPKMQEAGCVLLTNLAHNCETNRRRILDGGGIDSVLQAMQTFPENPGVQKRSCWALLTLAGSDLMCDSIAMRGGLGAIIAAMLNCPADDHVQYYGSWALVNLLSGTERLQAFARREGVREVAEAAHACFPEHEGIQEKALEILRLLR